MKLAMDGREQKTESNNGNLMNEEIVQQKCCCGVDEVEWMAL